MKLIFFIIFIILNSLTSIAFSKSLAVVNLQFLIDNNIIYNDVVKEMELEQKIYLKEFEIRENELKLVFEEIEASKLILNENELNFQIDNYNKELSEFSMLIEEFNIHYQNQIMNLREVILKEIIKLLEKYAIDNKIDLILDSSSYLIASNSLDITNDIYIELEKLEFKLEYTNFE